jgi:hypothetical protein
MTKYKFSKKFNFWTEDHRKNFDSIGAYFSEAHVSYPILKFLEIGVFEGRTSCWLLDNILIFAGDILHCIDPNLTKNGKYNLSFHPDKIIHYNEPSFKVLTAFNFSERGPFDFIYVDGDHNACGLLEDMILSWKLLRVEGIMLIDDYEMEATDPWHYVSHPEFKDNPRLRFTHPRIAIDAFLNIYRGQYDLIIDNYQIGIKKIVNFPQ